MTFTKWILSQQHRADPVGDLARDVAEDRNWPDSGELDGYSDYLAGMHAAGTVFDALERAWSEYIRI